MHCSAAAHDDAIDACCCLKPTGLQRGPAAASPAAPLPPGLARLRLSHPLQVIAIIRERDPASPLLKLERPPAELNEDGSRRAGALLSLLHAQLLPLLRAPLLALLRAMLLPLLCAAAAGSCAAWPRSGPVCKSWPGSGSGSLARRPRGRPI